MLSSLQIAAISHHQRIFSFMHPPVLDWNTKTCQLQLNSFRQKSQIKLLVSQYFAGFCITNTFLVVTYHTHTLFYKVYDESIKTFELILMILHATSLIGNIGTFIITWVDTSWISGPNQLLHVEKEIFLKHGKKNKL